MQDRISKTPDAVLTTYMVILMIFIFGVKILCRVSYDLKYIS